MTQTNSSNPKAAVLSIIASMAVLGVIDNSIPLLAQEIGIWQFKILRASIAVPILVIVAFFGFGQIFPKRWKWVFLRNLAMIAGVMCYFSALAFLPISHGLAGLLTAPLWVVVFTALFRGIAIGPIRYFAVGIGFIGTLLVLNISWSSISILSFVPIMSGVLYAIAQIITRDYCADESPVSMLAMMMVLQFIAGSTMLVVLSMIDPIVPAGSDGFVLRGWVWPIETAWPWIALQAVGSLIGVGFAIRAYQLGEASYVAIFEYTIFVFGLATAFFAFGQVPDLIQFVGIGLIVFAGSMIALRLS